MMTKGQFEMSIMPNGGWKNVGWLHKAYIQGPFMRHLILLLLLTITFGAAASAQQWTDYLSGPFHRPTVEVDEFGNLRAPLQMYEDGRIETSIPDFTGTYESVMRPAAFKEKGDYSFILYVYHKDSHKTSRTLVSGNAQTGEIQIDTMDDLGGLFGPVLKFHHNKGMPLPVDRTVLAYMKLMVYLKEAEGRVN